MRQTCLGSMKINENMFNIARLWATLFGQWAEVVVNSEKHSYMSTVLRQIFNVYNHKHNTTACNKCDTVHQNIDKHKHFVCLGLLSLDKVRVDFALDFRIEFAALTFLFYLQVFAHRKRSVWYATSSEDIISSYDRCRTWRKK